MAKDSVWMSLWTIVGPRLPAREVQINDRILIKPISAAAEESMARDPALTINPPQPFHVLHFPPRDRVKSQHLLQVNVTAKNYGEAWWRASELGSQLVTSLTLGMGQGEYFAELRMLTRADDPTNESTAQGILFRVLEKPNDVRFSELEKCIELFDLYERDKTARNALNQIQTAWQLEAIQGTKPLSHATLLHYVLSIEAIVNGVMKDRRKSLSDQIRLEERKFAAQFARTLPERADKPGAIRAASTKLREIGFLNTIPSIEEVGKELSIPDEAVTDAVELYRFRSRNLGHPGQKDEEKIRQWLSPGFGGQGGPSRADGAARAFIIGYRLKR